MQAAVARVGDNGGDDSVIGSLARGIDVGVALSELEARTAVLQREAAAGGDDGGAEAGEVAVDEGDAVAEAVGHGEVDRVAVVVRWGAVGEDRGGFVRGEEFCALGEVAPRDQLGGGNFFDGGVRDPPVCVCEGDAEGFDHGVEMLGTVVVGFGPDGDFARSFEFFENAEGHEGDDALAVGRMFPDFDTVLLVVIAFLALFLALFLAVRPIFAVQAGFLGFVNVLSAELERDSLNVFGTQFHVILKVLELEMTPKVVDHFDQSLCHLTSVEACLATFC